jgi:ABC-type transport system involved in multi-copper enzyme maturation permease subunit
MTGLELRQRVRSIRWYVALGLWFLILLGLSLLILGATGISSGEFGPVRASARITFSLEVMHLVFAVLLVLPALSAGSINGDRSAGTLAILQVSRLSPMEIAVGKLLAGWVTGLAFLVAALPSIVPLAVLGGVSVFYLFRVLLMVAFLALVITALGLGLSSLTARQLGSVVLTYVVVLGATFILPVAWGTSTVMLIEEKEKTVYDQEWSDSMDGPGQCVASERTESIVHSEYTMFLVWPNPMVMVAEMSPTIDQQAWSDGDGDMVDVLQLMRTGIRYAASPEHPSNFNYCSPDAEGYPDLGTPEDRPVWPLGMGIWTLIALGSLAVTVQRLDTPIRTLTPGTRIA